MTNQKLQESVHVVKQVVKQENSKTLKGVFPVERYGARSHGKKRIVRLERKWKADFLHQSRWLVKLTNRLMQDGKKGKAEKIVMEMLERINQDSQGNAVTIFHQALEQLKPILSLVRRQVGGRVYEIPVPVPPIKQYKFALTWLVEAAKKNKQVPLAEGLADELMGTVFSNRSEALKRKEELYTTAIKNRAYLHFRWA